MIQRLQTVGRALLTARWTWGYHFAAFLFLSIATIVSQTTPMFRRVMPSDRPWRWDWLTMELVNDPSSPQQEIRWQPFDPSTSGLRASAGPALPWDQLVSNPKLTHFDLSSYRLMATPHVDTIEEAHRHSPPVTLTEQLKRLHELTQLEWLTLPPCELNSQLIEQLTPLKQLRWLDVSVVDSPNGLASLPLLPRLQTLVVESLDRLTPESISRLAELPELSQLIVTQYVPRGNTTYGSNSSLGELSNLERRTLDDLRQLPHLRQLRVAGRDFTPVYAAARTALPQVAVLPLMINSTQRTGTLLALVGTLCRRWQFCR